FDLEAGRNLILQGSGPNGTDDTRLSASGGSALGYYYVYPGGGGRTSMEAPQIDVGPDVILEANTSNGKTECPDAYGGTFYLYPTGDDFLFDGKLIARGQSGCGIGGTVYVFP